MEVDMKATINTDGRKLVSMIDVIEKMLDKDHDNITKRQLAERISEAVKEEKCANCIVQANRELVDGPTDKQVEHLVK